MKIILNIFFFGYVKSVKVFEEGSIYNLIENRTLNIIVTIMGPSITGSPCQKNFKFIAVVFSFIWQPYE